uniref:Cell division protein FtsY homolog, chloroplastic n=1 Tax=Tanacetum cinerariifolium TaxID=118510 RepID=A0A699IXC5_TANCI|nr:cell division protein FtsY homolog, chloroplastic [Tanacetum cinerariifolium]
MSSHHPLSTKLSLTQNHTTPTLINHHHHSLRVQPNFRCSAAAAGSETGFFTKLGRLIKEKAKKDVEKIFTGGFSKTRDNLAVIDELLLYWNLSDTDRVLDELEEWRSLSKFVGGAEMIQA